MTLLILLCLAAFIAIVFVLCHLRPLTDEEVDALARRRRDRAVQRYYHFDRRGWSVNSHFKKKMAANGSLYSINESLLAFPSIAAGLLKYKKHEWMIIAFERNQRIDKIWLNKGPDRSQVQSAIGLQSVKDIAKSGSYTSVLILHNHPNSDPSRYSMVRASSKDKESAADWARQLCSDGVNLVDFVCERGGHHEYWRAVSDSFFPVADFISVLQRANGVRRVQNFKLHWERLFEN